MIQRIQSIYLFLVTVLAGLFLVLPVETTINKGETTWIQGMDNMMILGVSVAIAAVSLISIFLFFKRAIQMKIVLLSMLLTVGLTLILLTLYFASEKSSSDFFEYTFGIPAILLILQILAYWNIRKDEKLVKSADRLR